MPITVNHSTPADGSFSASGATAWNANHSLVGVGTMAEQNANAVAITGGTATLTSVTTPIVQATNSAGLALRNSAGTTQISMGAGGGDNITLASSTNINGTNAQIDISPTGTGHVHIKPTGVNSIEIAPTFAGTMNNMIIGGTTANAITGTTITATSFVGSGASLTGVVTSVTGTAPVVSSGGQTPAISMAAANTTTNGYLTSTDWNTFNGKSNTTGTVTSVGGTGTVNGLTLTGTVTTSGNLTLGGTLDLSSPPAIGATAANTGKFTTLTANTVYIAA